MKVWNAATSRMRCMATMRVLQTYLDGALDDVAARRVAEHLEDCRRCGLEAEVYQEIKTALGEHDQPLDPRAVERLRHFGEQLARGDASAHRDHGA
jgi:anti-sigma factor RsiW